MKKKDLVASMMKRSGLTKNKCEDVLSTLTEIVGDSLRDGEKISLAGFGTFEAKDRAARVGRNPRTGELIDIPAAKIPVFRAGKKLKNKVAQKISK